MKMERRILTTLALILAFHVGQAQSFKAFVDAARDAEMLNDHYNAMSHYGDALEFDEENLEIRERYANAARLFNAYEIAKEHYLYVFENDDSGRFPNVGFYLAEVQQKTGAYEDAKRNYELYLSEHGSEDPYLTQKAEKEIAAIDFAIEKTENPYPGRKVTRMGENVNTPYSEFGAIKLDDKLYYSSLRFEKEEKSRAVNRLFAKILTSEDGLGSPVEGDLNDSPQHVAHTAFNASGDRLYYTICEYLEDLDIRCDLYYRDVFDRDNFGPAVRLPDHINAEVHTSTQPSIGFDAHLQKEVLYFSSDREGGQGGDDIWYSVIDGDNFSPPVNVENINTAYNEITPFYHSETSTLYFSSEGYLSIGGYDVYKSGKEGDVFGPVVNMELPVNSSYNDLYFVLDESGTKGHMSSNRLGCLYIDDFRQAACYDIYDVDFTDIEINLNALTFNAMSRDSLPGATVRLIDPLTGQEIDLVYNELGPDHRFLLTAGQEYLIIGEKEGFKSDTIRYKAVPDDGTEVIKKLYLTPMTVRLEVYSFHAETLEELSGVTVMLKDLAEPGVPPVEHPNKETNFFSFDILSGRQYEIVASKPEFSTATVLVDATKISEGKIVKKVYLKPDPNYLLPLTVYFDNDRPDRKTLSTYTTKSYTDTYYPYIAKKEIFKERYSAPLQGDLKQNARSAIDNFFEYDVTGGYMKLQRFMDLLKDRLVAGDKIEVFLKGFASPLALNKYNLALGQRRIWTIKNEIAAFAGGVMKPYIESGMLQVTEVSFGEETSSRQISDSARNQRLSVYSLEASKERKSEVVRIRILN